MTARKLNMRSRWTLTFLFSLRFKNFLRIAEDVKVDLFNCFLNIENTFLHLVELRALRRVIVRNTETERIKICNIRKHSLSIRLSFCHRIVESERKRDYGFCRHLVKESHLLPESARMPFSFRVREIWKTFRMSYYAERFMK